MWCSLLGGERIDDAGGATDPVQQERSFTVALPLLGGAVLATVAVGPKKGRESLLKLSGKAPPVLPAVSD